MASTTTNLGLTKPAYSDDADISDINSNMDLIDAEAGKVRGNVAANYDSSETYAVGDYCLHDGSLYKCSTTISSPEAWTAGHWTQIKITGELSTLNGKITMHSSYLSGADSGTTLNIIKYNYDFAFITFTSANKTWAEGDSFGTLPVSAYPVENIRTTGNMYGSNVGVQVRIGVDGSVKYDSQNSVSGRISFTVMYVIEH